MRISDWSSDVCSSELGSFHFLTGSSGAGKTSLLRMLYLAQRPSRGFISIFGEDVVTMPRGRLPALRRRIGGVFQDFRLGSTLSAFDNIALPLGIEGVGGRKGVVWGKRGAVSVVVSGRRNTRKKN